MKMKIVLWLLSAAVVIIIFLNLWGGALAYSYGLPKSERIEKIILSPKGDSIYITARFWGITGDHEEIIFSEKPIILPPNKDKHYIFYTDEVFYKFENNDELVIHAPKSGKSIPKIPFKNIKVVLKDLKTGDDIRNIGENYKKYKLEKIGVRGGD